MRLCRLTLGLICLAAAWATASGGNPTLLTAEDLAVLEQENKMWRAVRTDLEVAENLQLLKALGHDPSDLAWFALKLEQLWQLPGARGLGALNSDTREKIEEVERDFVSLYRATRRFEETGVRPSSGPLYTRGQLNTLWRKAMTQALSYEEMRDYSLARSDEAKRVERLSQGLTLTSIEQRELIRMAREFGDRDNTLVQPRPTLRAFLEAQLDYYSAIRSLLGDERFVPYLERANEDFLFLRQALPEGTSPVTALDCFWLRLKTGIALRKPVLPPAARQAIGAQAREEIAGILEESGFRHYQATEHARWLYPR
jgi:hypothetical protein